MTLVRSWLSSTAGVTAAAVCLLLGGLVMTNGSEAENAPPDNPGGTTIPVAPATSAEPTPVPTARTPSPSVTASGTALALITRLATRGRAPRTGYSREAFGQAWLDTDRNGCDTRNDILRRDLRDVVLKAGTRGCLVLSGLANPEAYTGASVPFTRGASRIDIDHVVALADAWQKGAGRWPLSKRAAFANDPLNLLAVSASANRQKSDGDAATWLPPNRGYRCAYAARQVAVKAKYEVWVTTAERAALVRILSTCPTQGVPRSAHPTVAAVAAGIARPGLDRQFRTCAEAKGYGLGPYVRGKDAEYGWYSDRDGDGVACER